MPDLMLLAKLLHLFAVVVMTGATVINGLIHQQAQRSAPGDAAALLRVVLQINRWLMAPALLLIPATGSWLAISAGYGFTAVWLRAAAVLSLALILAFIAGLRIERRLFSLAAAAATEGARTLPASYPRIFRRAVPVGTAALAMSLAAMALMVFKPV